MGPVSEKRHPLPIEQDTHLGGLPMQTNLRAGLAWDDLDDQAAALWQQLTSSVSKAISGLNAGNSDTSSAS